jgi:4a-hydroxytetrahydrobiopterin dehydratase
VTDADIRELKPQIAEWALIERDGIPRLERLFRFPNFAQALAFTNLVGALAEEEGHHPAILTEWGRVTVTLWTHKIRGLHPQWLYHGSKDRLADVKLVNDDIYLQNQGRFRLDFSVSVDDRARVAAGSPAALSLDKNPELKQTVMVPFVSWS